ncbi:putative Na+/H+ antiporter, partial [Streptomyces caeruleatus]
KKPSKTLAYATLGLLFVNISIGGVLTNFAAPPVLMVAEKWCWTNGYMFRYFGLKSIASILLSNMVYFIFFYKQLKSLKKT